MRVDQYVPGFAPYDAIGRHALQVRRVLRGAGFDSDIWAEQIHAPLEREARPWHPGAGRAASRGGGGGAGGGNGAVMLYQCSTNSAMAGWLVEQGAEGRRIWSQYHNITPAIYFERWDRRTAQAMTEGREQLGALAPVVELAMAVSGFNQKELLDAGYSRAAVTPLLVDLDDYHRPPNPKTLARLRRRQRGAEGAQWLFVGRFVPNKCQHDVIAAFAAYRHLVDHAARLTLVGAVGQPRYHWALRRLAFHLDLGDSVELLSGLAGDDLLAHWAVADVFVCMSEHEGFCVPLLEAMTLGVPVVAYAGAAVPETLGGAGALVDGKDPEAVAQAVALVARPGARRDTLIKAGYERAAAFTLARSSARFLGVVREVLGG
ncbi:MAG TPA: glycosyltransferase [Acidimicrobiales bacterium]|nr:glycosyltransferase [Acidimicrobiales bacterium]